MGCGHSETSCWCGVKSFLEVVKVAQELEIGGQPVIRLRFHSSAMEDVVCVTLGLALVNEVRQSRRFVRR